MEGDPLRHDVGGDVHGEGVGVDAQHVHPAAGSQDLQAEVERLLAPGHLQYVVHHPPTRLVGDGRLQVGSRPQDQVRPQLLGQAHPVLVHVAHGEDPSRGQGPAEGHAHQARGPQAEDGHVVAGDVGGEDGLHGVPEGVLDGGHLQRQVRRIHDDVLLRHRHVLGEGPVPVYADDVDVGANVGLARAALEAGPAGYVPLRRHVISHPDVGRVGSKLRHVAGELVALDEGGLDACLGPRVPVVDVDVGPAEGGDAHLDQNLAGPRLRPRNLH